MYMAVPGNVRANPYHLFSPLSNRMKAPGVFSSPSEGLARRL